MLHLVCSIKIITRNIWRVKMLCEFSLGIRYMRVSEFFVLNQLKFSNLEKKRIICIEATTHLIDVICFFISIHFYPQIFRVYEFFNYS